MPASCAIVTPLAIAVPSCGTITSTSTSLVISFSTSLICTVSSLLAASTRTLAPSSPGTLDEHVAVGLPARFLERVERQPDDDAVILRRTRDPPAARREREPDQHAGHQRDDHQQDADLQGASLHRPQALESNGGPATARQRELERVGRGHGALLDHQVVGARLPVGLRTVAVDLGDVARLRIEEIELQRQLRADSRRSARRGTSRACRAACARSPRSRRLRRRARCSRPSRSARP